VVRYPRDDSLFLRRSFRQTIGTKGAEHRVGSVTKSLCSCADNLLRRVGNAWVVAQRERYRGIVVAGLPPDITNRGASFQERHKSKGGMRKLRSTVAGSKLDLYRSSHPPIPAIQETTRRLRSIGLSREGPFGVKPYFGYPSNDPTRRAWPPYAISDKLDDTLLQVLATRLEARGQHSGFQAMFTEYLDAISIDAARSNPCETACSK
jgi:hypothetical protein